MTALERDLLKALEEIVRSYERSNAELLNAGLLPEGKQPKYILIARAAIAKAKP